MLKRWLAVPMTAAALALPAVSAVPATAADEPTVTASGLRGLKVTDTKEVTVNGSGFDPAVKNNPAVAGLYVAFGPNPADVPGGFLNPGLYHDVEYLPMGPDSSGKFTTKLTVTGAYTDQQGTTWNGAEDELGISTWAAHAHATTAWDSFKPVTFRTPAEPKTSSTSRARLTDRPKAPGSTARLGVKVKTGTDVVPTGSVKVFTRWDGRKRLLDHVQLRKADDGRTAVRFTVKQKWCDSTVKVWFRYGGSDSVRRSVSDVERLTVR